MDALVIGAVDDFGSSVVVEFGIGVGSLIIVELNDKTKISLDVIVMYLCIDYECLCNISVKTNDQNWIVLPLDLFVLIYPTALIENQI